MMATLLFLTTPSLACDYGGAPAGGPVFSVVQPQVQYVQQVQAFAVPQYVQQVQVQQFRQRQKFVQPQRLNVKVQQRRGFLGNQRLNVRVGGY